MIANADGGSERLLATRRNPDLFVPAFFTGPSWSPDGSVIVASTRNRAVERARLTTFDTRTGAERELYSADSDITFTQWLPDGTGVLFVSRPFVNFSGTAGQLWLRSSPEGQVRRITNDVLDYRKVSVAADGATLLAIGQEVESKVYLVPLDGSAPQRIPTERYDGLQGIAQLPDQSLIVTTVVSGQSQILHVSSDGRTRTLLTRDGANTFPAVSRDGTKVSDGVDPRRSDRGVANEHRRQRSAPAGAHPRGGVALVHCRRQPCDLLVVRDHRALDLECADRRRSGS